MQVLELPDYVAVVVMQLLDGNRGRQRVRQRADLVKRKALGCL